MDEIVCTHSFTAVSAKEISPKRTVRVSRFSDGTTAIAIMTYQDGDNKEPFTTKMRLTPVALEVLSGALFEAAHNIDKWEYKPQTDEAGQGDPVVDELAAALGEAEEIIEK